MFLLKKLLTVLLLPPGVLIALWGVLLFLLRNQFRRKRAFWAAALLSLPFVLTWVIATEPFSAWVMRGLEDRHPTWDHQVKGARCIVLLGGGTLAGAPDEEGRPVLALEALRRAQAAARVSRETGLPIVATGGVVFRRQGPTVPEGEVMRDALTAFGVPANRIFTEVASRDTDDNARLTAVVLSNQDLGREILLVTSAYHMPRSVRLFSRHGMSPIPVPTDYRTERGPGARHQGAEALLRLLPQAKDFSRSVTALREWYGLLFYGGNPRP